jgi:hypothetical protein
MDLWYHLLVRYFIQWAPLNVGSIPLPTFASLSKTFQLSDCLKKIFLYLFLQMDAFGFFKLRQK